MLQAVQAVRDQRRQDLHDQEKAVALQTWWVANSQRDTDKAPEPFPLEDFYCHAGQQGRPPEDEYPPAAGAAAAVLAERGALPPFVLGPWWDDLLAAGEGEPLPAQLGWVNPEAVLLAPTVRGPYWCGYLVACREAAGRDLEFRDESGAAVVLALPADLGAEGPVEARASAQLPIARSAGAPTPPGSLPVRMSGSSPGSPAA